jgi:FtsZ-binding cell division protein ZapB
MANIAKFTKGAVNGLSLHDTRAKKPNGEYYKHKNQEIDTSRSHLNYNLAPHNLNPREFVNKRLQEVHCLKRDDVKVMATCIVTKPIGVKAEEQELFFQETYKFLEKDFGKENVAGAWVHLDETTPHLHFSFVPVVFDKKKEKLKVSAKEVLNRSYFEKYHTRLEKHLEKVFGREVGILNDATKEGNKSIDELKKETAIKTLNELKKFEEFKNTPAPALEKLAIKLIPKEHFGMFKRIELLEQDINTLKIENNALKSDIESKDMTIKKQEQENTVLKEKNNVFTEHKIQALKGKGVLFTNAMYNDLSLEVKARIKKAVPEIDEKVLDNAFRDSNPVFREMVKAPKPVQTLGLGE